MLPKVPQQQRDCSANPISVWHRIYIYTHIYIYMCSTYSSLVLRKVASVFAGHSGLSVLGLLTSRSFQVRTIQDPTKEDLGLGISLIWSFGRSHDDDGRKRMQPWQGWRRLAVVQMGGDHWEHFAFRVWSISIICEVQLAQIGWALLPLGDMCGGDLICVL